jgi:hypothetical protein
MFDFSRSESFSLKGLMGFSPAQIAKMTRNTPASSAATIRRAGKDREGEWVRNPP